MKIPIIILNLERSADRRDFIKSQLEKLNINNYLFYPAFDGKLNINQSFSPVIISGYGLGRKMLSSEIFLTVSHIAIFKHCKTNMLST